jgi:D-alanine-D-alanine ligase-like ATP-grasp enzyme
MPDFAGMSMYQKLFAASGIPYGQLLDELLDLAMEDRK